MRDLSLWYDQHAQPLPDPIAVEELRSDLRYRNLASTTLTSRADPAPEREVWVSTVWLGLDHSFSDSTPPLIFETMAFQGGMSEIYCDRYHTIGEAFAGHGRAVVAMIEHMHAQDGPDVPLPHIRSGMSEEFSEVREKAIKEAWERMRLFNQEITHGGGLGAVLSPGENDEEPITTDPNEVAAP